MLLKIKNIIKKYCRYSADFPVIVFFSVFFLGIIVWGGFNTAMEVTNTEAFCISCHEMKDTVYQEYKQTIHFSNRTGVKASCPDCHVPRDWGHKVLRKISASNELFHKLIGSIDTKEKFENKRLELAEDVWKVMRSTDSRECRNCHSFNDMNISKQKKSSRLAHERGIKKGLTCMDCHMGIAHHIAKDFDKDLTLHNRFKRENRPCADCHKGMQQAEW